MKTSEAIKEIMEKRGISQAALGRMMKKTTQTVWDRLNQRDMTIGKAVEMLLAMDYKLVIMPRGQKTPEGGYEVE